MNKSINAINRLLSSVGLVIIGIVIIRQADKVIPLLRIITLVALAFLSISRFISIFIGKEKAKEDFIYFLVYLVIIFLILHFPNIYTRFISFTVAIYALINAIIQFINFAIYRNNHVQGVIFSLFRGILDLGFAVSLIILPFVASQYIFIISGIYLFIYALFNAISWLKILFNEKMSISVSLPAVVTALLPAQLYMRIKNDPKMEEYIKHEPKDSLYPLEISVYTHDGGFEAIGHIDVTLNKTVYSYGLHDPKKRFLFGSAGEGVLVVTDRNSFFKTNLSDGKTMIFNFQFDLNEKDIKTVEERIALLMKDAYPFDCDAKIEESQGLPIKANDYISRVYKDTHCNLYKFDKGPFKTYFVFTQNCIQLTDFLVRNKDIDLLKMSGIITPGAYLSFLYSLHEKNDSLVKNLDIYK